MDIINQALGTGLIFLDTMVMTDVSTSGNGSVSSQNGPWHAISWRSEYQAVVSNSGLLQSDSSRVITNEGALSSGQFILPLAADSEGVTYTFVRVASQPMIITPNTSDNFIYSVGVMTAGELLQLDSDGAKLAIVSDGGTNWIAIDEFGTLTEET
jgi:hypothetical protein